MPYTTLERINFLYAMQYLSNKKCENKLYYVHVKNLSTWKGINNNDSFYISDQTNSKFKVKIKEALHALWKKSTLNVKFKQKCNLKL